MTFRSTKFRSRRFWFHLAIYFVCGAVLFHILVGGYRTWRFSHLYPVNGVAIYDAEWDSSGWVENLADSYDWPEQVQEFLDLWVLANADKFYVMIRGERREFDPKKMLLLKRLKNLTTHLSLDKFARMQNGFELTASPKLEHLSLSGSIDSEFWKSVKGLAPNLEGITLHDVDGFNSFHLLPKLENLNIFHSAVNETELLACLTANDQLTKFALYGMRISIANLFSLEQKPNLKILVLQNMTDVELASLARFAPNLLTLNIANSDSIKNQDLEHLVKLHKLEELNLNGNLGLTDDAENILSKVSKLKKIGISGTSISPAVKSRIEAGKEVIPNMLF